MTATSARSLLRGFSSHEGVVVDPQDELRLSFCQPNTSFTNSVPTIECSDSDSDDNVSLLLSDDELLVRADAHSKEERLLEAGRLLRKVDNRARINESQRKVMRKAAAVQVVVDEAKTMPSTENGYTKHCENHGKYDTSCYYIMEGNEMTMRIEAILPKGLRVPLLGVLSEINSWESWMPRITFPVKMGVGETRSLKKSGRFDQILRAELMLPIISNRETVMETTFCDAVDEDDCFVILVGQPNEADIEGGLIPVTELERVEMQLGLVIQTCSSNHPLTKNSKHEYPKDEPLVHITFTAFIRPSINLFIRNFFPPLFLQLLRITEETQKGKRPVVSNMIKEKKEEYDWFLERCDAMLENFTI